MRYPQASRERQRISNDVSRRVVEVVKGGGLWAAGDCQALVPRGVDSLQCDDVVEPEVRRAVLVGLRSTRRIDHRGVHQGIRARLVDVVRPGAVRCEEVVHRCSQRTLGVLALDGVVVGGDLGRVQGDRLDSALLTEVVGGESGARSLLDRVAAAQIGESEGRPAVAAVGRS